MTNAGNFHYGRKLSDGEKTTMSYDKLHKKHPQNLNEQDAEWDKQDRLEAAREERRKRREQT